MKRTFRLEHVFFLPRNFMDEKTHGFLVVSETFHVFRRRFVFRRQKEQRLGRDSELLYATQQRQGGMELKKVACG